MSEVCPNCRVKAFVLLYETEHGVTHCGCFHEGDPGKVRFHVSTFKPESESGETKSEIRARLDEIEKTMVLLAREGDEEISDGLLDRAQVLQVQLESAEEDLFKSVVQSHKVLCAYKEMEEDAAYGQDPAMYYTMGVCGEAGEMANKIVKALRNGNDPEAAKAAVESELPDVIIYSAVLAHVLGINLTKLVNDKVEIVVDRAKGGYYGGPLPKDG